MSLWPAVHAERRALCDDLEQLHGQQWAVQSLCGRWTAEEVVAHLTAAASTGRLRWLASMVGARFDSSLHNQRRMAEQRGADPDETLQSFRRIVTSSTAPSGHVAAWLGEVVVHGQDIRRPLGIEGAPPVDRITEVADFFAGRDFTVKSRTAIKGLRLEAVDGPFTTGEGPLVTGTTLALTMAMAGRAAFCDDLDGDGVATLRGRSRPA